MQPIGRIAAAWATLAVTAAVALLGSTGHPALAATTPHPSPDPEWTVRDRVLPRTSASDHRVGRRSESVYRGTGNQTIRVFSTAYGATEVQPLVDTLTSFPHGREMDSVHLFVANESQLERTCGSAARACYDPYSEQIIVSGNPDPEAGVPRDFVLAHEYGHHIENHQRNSPWDTLEWGTKRWATYKRVCSGVRSGAFHPGNQAYNYWSNPGEAFAETYAHAVYPHADVAWYFDDQLAPDPGAMRAALLDATDPWRGPRAIRWRFGVGKRGPRAKIRALPMPLDGRLHVWVKEPKGTNLALRLLPDHGGHVLARSVDVGPREDLRFNVCGREKVRVRIVVRRGVGRFEVRALRP
jgi:hypothetical protein